jgi:hypothetical protein
MAIFQTLRSRMPSWLIGLCFCSLVLGYCAWQSREFAHWFIIPVFLCGALISPAGVDWIRGRIGLFDPAGIVGMFGIHFFFLAPLLHVLSDEWLRYVVHPPEWREWLGRMACINVAGIMAYFVGLRIMRRKSAPPATWRWQLQPQIFTPLLLGALLLSALVQLAVYAKFGGIQGYITKFSTDVTESFAGWGFLFMFSESFPILAAIGFAV